MESSNLRVKKAIGKTIKKVIVKIKLRREGEKSMVDEI